MVGAEGPEPIGSWPSALTTGVPNDPNTNRRCRRGRGGPSSVLAEFVEKEGGRTRQVVLQVIEWNWSTVV